MSRNEMANLLRRYNEIQGAKADGRRVVLKNKWSLSPHFTEIGVR